MFNQTQRPEIEGAIVLDRGYTEDFEPDLLILDGNQNRSMGILHCSHEFSLCLDAGTLRFHHADSIDLGESFVYETEAEFEATYPGVIAEVRKAKDEGRLYVREYEWDAASRRNIPHLEPYQGH